MEHCADITRIRQLGFTVFQTHYRMKKALCSNLSPLRLRVWIGLTFAWETLSQFAARDPSALYRFWQRMPLELAQLRSLTLTKAG